MYIRNVICDIFFNNYNLGKNDYGNFLKSRLYDI